MSIAYRYIDGGFLEQQDPDGSWSVHTLTGAEKAMFDKNAPQYADLVRTSAIHNDMIEAPIWGIGFGESGWKQPASASFDGGHGLMQITAQGLKQGLPDSEVDKPENNIRLGADYLRKLSDKYGADIVKMASGYNCGSAKPGSGPWGYCEYKIPSTGAYPYISKVVRAYNYAIQNPPQGSPPSGDHGGGGNDAGGGGSDDTGPIVAAFGAAALLLYIGFRLTKG